MSSRASLRILTDAAEEAHRASALQVHPPPPSPPNPPPTRPRTRRLRPSPRGRREALRGDALEDGETHARSLEALEDRRGARLDDAKARTRRSSRPRTGPEIGAWCWPRYSGGRVGSRDRRFGGGVAEEDDVRVERPGRLAATADRAAAVGIAAVSATGHGRGTRGARGPDAAEGERGDASGRGLFLAFPWMGQRPWVVDDPERLRRGGVAMTRGAGPGLTVGFGPGRWGALQRGTSRGFRAPKRSSAAGFRRVFDLRQSDPVRARTRTFSAIRAISRPT